MADLGTLSLVFAGLQGFTKAAVIPALTSTTGAAAATGAVATAGMSAYGASQQNAALKKGIEAQMLAASQGTRQLAQATGQQQEGRIREANQLAARIRVARGEAGVGMGGSTATLVRQVDTDAARDLETLDTNYLFGAGRIQSGANAQITQLNAQSQNPLVSAFLGGLQGIGTGLQIGQGINQLRRQ